MRANAYLVVCTLLLSIAVWAQSDADYTYGAPGASGRWLV
jgi:hypothetical protein